MRAFFDLHSGSAIPRQHLADAGLARTDVGVLLADGAGSPDLDTVEAEAIHQMLGKHASRVPVTAPSSATP
ncbi:hypothetical protein [Frankia sp. Cas4]|uniref:hypothetical protein n=1 Tax=Frankia sp. Cas4 TaxID=3073927 RepID=UPI002AD33982|nr:hypothetical protein [Frankia sp. Cas4]